MARLQSLRLRLTQLAIYAALLLLLLLSLTVPVTQAKRSFREIQFHAQIRHLERTLGPPPAPDGQGPELEYILDTTLTASDSTSPTAEDIDDLLPPGVRLASLTPNTTPNTTLDTPWTPPPIHNGTAILPINHFGPSPPPHTFRNRFWVVDAYYRPGGPVFTFDTGEAEDGYAFRGYLTSNASFFNQYLREFGGLGVLWEHRYYGESFPFAEVGGEGGRRRVDLNTTSGELRWLTTEQALEDFRVFAGGFRWRIGGAGAQRGGGDSRGRRAPGGWNGRGRVLDLRPGKTPWVHIGGSYPGMRAALLRSRYPSTIFAAYASSAPLQAAYNMTIYWTQVHRSLLASGALYAACASNIHLALSYIDTQLSLSPGAAAGVKQLFLGRTAERNSHEAFSDTLFYPLYNFQSLGPARDPVLSEFCGVLARGNTAQQPDRREGTGRVLADRWAKWPGFAALVNENNPGGGGYCEGFATDETRRAECRVDGRFEGVLGVAWTWQYCTEWGFLQATNVGPEALGSRYNTLAHQAGLCARQFPDAVPPPWPRTAETNARFGGWGIRPSNTFFTGGEFDPWRPLSVLSGEADGPGVEVSGEIPGCNVGGKKGEGGKGGTVFGYLLRGAQHCFDFNTVEETPEAEVPQRLFARALGEWLGCFRAERGGDGVPVGKGKGKGKGEGY